MIDNTSVGSSNGSFVLGDLGQSSGADLWDALERSLSHFGFRTLGSLGNEMSNELST
jgi:hypothetical protein